MREQQFSKGDYVKVAKDLGPGMSHFTSDCEAIVIGSYADQYGGEDRESYTIHIKNKGEVSWYYGSQLKLIESSRIDLLKTWEEEEAAEVEEKSSLDWIFSHGADVLAKPHGATISALAKCFTEKSLWGDHGEGIVYYENSMVVLISAMPFLMNNDKAGWLDACEKVSQ